MKTLRTLTLLLCLGLTALGMQACSRHLDPETPCSFVQNPQLQRVSWQRHLPVKLYLHSSVDAEYYPAIDRAVAEYNLKVGGGKEIFKIIARGVSGDLSPKKDGYSMLYWYKTWDADRASEQARTTIFWSGVEIFEADIRINGADFSYYTGENSNFSGVDFQSLLVHEFGHVLGLAHNPSAGSVMYFSLNHGQERRALGKQDLANLKCEY